MTMFPASKQQHHHLIYHNGYGGSCGVTNRIEEEYDHPMAEDETRTNSTIHNELGSNSNKEEKDDEGWLQLGITTINSDLITTRNSSSVLTDLQLLPPATTSRQDDRDRSLESNFHVPEIETLANFGTSSIDNFNDNWLYFNSTCSSSSSSLMPLLGSSSSSYFGTRQFQMQTGSDDIFNPGPSLDFRVVNPPRRPQSGIWFMLKASQNQAKEPFLPQISKSYLRIRDGKMTVGLLMKYLVNKLRLKNELEVEIACRGQELRPLMTLQHIRDNIWSPSAAVTTTTSLLPESSTTYHVMVLHYGWAMLNIRGPSRIDKCRFLNLGLRKPVRL